MNIPEYICHLVKKSLDQDEIVLTGTIYEATYANFSWGKLSIHFLMASIISLHSYDDQRHPPSGHILLVDLAGSILQLHYQHPTMLVQQISSPGTRTTPCLVAAFSTYWIYGYTIRLHDRACVQVHQRIRLIPHGARLHTHCLSLQAVPHPAEVGSHQHPNQSLSRAGSSPSVFLCGYGLFE